MTRVRNFLNWYAKLTPKRKAVSPPYEHVVQIGDPVLRKVCQEVPIGNFKSKELKDLVGKLTDVMRKRQCVGMSAPQIGVELRVFVMEMTQEQKNIFSDKAIENRQISVLPLTVCVNPTMKVLDYKKASYPEGCESVCSFEGEVPRYSEILLTFYNEDGEETSAKYTGWSARIAQHEFDHVNGVMYTDKMDPETFKCQNWSEVNKYSGNLAIWYSP